MRSLNFFPWIHRNSWIFIFLLFRLSKRENHLLNSWRDDRKCGWFLKQVKKCLKKNNWFNGLQLPSLQKEHIWTSGNLINLKSCFFTVFSLIVIKRNVVKQVFAIKQLFFFKKILCNYSICLLHIIHIMIGYFCW